MSNNGFIKLPRSLLNDPLWKSLPYTYRHVYLTILANVVYFPITMDDFGVLVHLKPGQMLTTERNLVELCDEPDIDKSLIHRSLVKFKNLDFSNQTSNHKKTIITITRKDILDLIEPNFEPNSNQTRTIKQEIKKDKKEKQQQTPASAGFVDVVVFSCLKNLGLTQADQVLITQKYQDDEKSVIAAVQQATKPGIKPKNLVGYILSLCEKKLVIEKTQEEKQEINRKLAVEYEKMFNNNSGLNFYALNRNCEICFSSQKQPIVIDYQLDPKIFSVELEKNLSYYGFNKQKKINGNH